MALLPELPPQICMPAEKALSLFVWTLLLPNCSSKQLSAVVSEEGLRTQSVTQNSILTLGSWFLSSGLLPDSYGCYTSYVMPFKATPNTEASLCSFLGHMAKAGEKGHSFCLCLCKAAKALTYFTGSWLETGAATVFLTVRLPSLLITQHSSVLLLPLHQLKDPDLPAR